MTFHRIIGLHSIPPINATVDTKDRLTSVIFILTSHAVVVTGEVRGGGTSDYLASAVVLLPEVTLGLCTVRLVPVQQFSVL